MLSPNARALRRAIVKLMKSRRSATIRVRDQGMAGLAGIRVKELDDARVELLAAGILDYTETDYGHDYWLIVKPKPLDV
jgi:hypothetical protein